MVRVTQIDDDGGEVAVIEVDDFTVEILYSGIAVMLKEAAVHPAAPVTTSELSPLTRQRRAKILQRLSA
jgi:hypothetical protein